MNLGLPVVKQFLSRGGSSLIYFGGVTLFAKTVPQSKLGVFFLYLALIGVLSLVADLGFRGAVEKRLSEGGDGPRLVGSALAAKLLGLAIVVGLLWLARGVVTDYVGTAITPLLIVGLIARELSELSLFVVRGELRVGETAIIRFTRLVTWLLAGWTFVWLGYGVEGVIVAHILGRFVELVWGVWRANTSLGLPSRESFASLVDYAKYQAIVAAGGRAYQWLDILLIGVFLQTRFVSAYEIAWNLTLLILLVSKSLELTLFPQISRWDAETRPDRIGETVTTALGYAMLVPIPALVGVVLYREEILRFLFTPEYVIAATVLVVLTVEKLVQSFNDIVNSSLRAIDEPRLAAKVTVASVGTNLLLTPVLIVWLGFVGAAIGTTTAWLVNAVLHERYLSRFVDFDFPVRLLSWYSVSAVAMGVVLLVVSRTFPVEGLPTLLGHIALGVVVYASALSVIPDVRRRVILPGVRAITA